MEVRRITLEKVRRSKAYFVLDGRKHIELLSHSERVGCLNRGVEKFNSDIQTTAENFKNHQLGKYLWCNTSEFIRHEEVVGLVWLYYFTEILREIKNKYGIGELRTGVKLPKSFYKFAKEELGLKVSYCFKHYAISFLLGAGLSSKKIIFSVKNNVKCLLSKNNYFHSGTLLDINQSFNKHRYDQIENVLNVFPDAKFFSGQENRLEGIDDKDEVHFRNELSFDILVKSILRSIKIAFFILRNKKNIPSFTYFNYSSFLNMVLLADILIYEGCVEKYFKKNKISTVVHTSTFNKPTYRMVVEKAKQHHARFILVASRTFFKTRPSENFLKCDIENYNDTEIPDYFILKDQYSLKIFDNYPELKNRTLIGGRYIFNNEEKNENNLLFQENKEIAILLLFVINKSQCIHFLNEIKHTDIDLSEYTIIYRSHPMQILDESIIKGYFPKSKLIDITNKSYSAIYNYNTIAISAPTTAALEAIQNGALLLWVPYIWEDAVATDDVMSDVGFKCDKRSKLQFELSRILKNTFDLNQKLESDIAYCIKNFNIDKLVSEQLLQLLNEEN